MRRTFIFSTITLGAVCGLFYLYPSPQANFTLITQDGKSALVYSCDVLQTDAQTLVQAEQAHIYFQEQIYLLAQREAAALLEAMAIANETGKLTDIEAIAAATDNNRRELVGEVDRKFDCLPTDESRL